MKKLIQIANLKGKPGPQVEAEIIGPFGIHKSIMFSGELSKSRYSVTILSVGGYIGFGLWKKDAVRLAKIMQGERTDWDAMTLKKWKKLPKKEIERLSAVKKAVLGVM